MPEMTGYDDGFFCWADLATTDLEAAKSFYSEIMGWEVADLQIDTGGIYAEFRSNGKRVAAANEQQEAEKVQGIPPHWNVYVSVSDIDKSAARAQELGAQTLLEPMDVMEVGRVAFLADPTGAVFGLWQAKTHFGAELLGEPGSMSWQELMTPDPKAAGDFYEQLFGWKVEDYSQPGATGPYTTFKIGEKYVGGMLSPPEGAPEIPPFWGIYFEVEDADKAVEKARSAGAEVRLEPMSAETVGRFAALADPQGAHFSVIKSEPAAGTAGS